MALQGIGYIDESYGPASTPDVLNLTCLVSSGATWFWFGLDWTKWLEAKNESLDSQGRKRLSRYHAADCSSLVGEFSGWTRNEQIEFTKGLLAVFQKHPMHIISYTLNLQELVQQLPETKPNPFGFAYILLLNYIMLEICDYTLKKQPAVMALIHDHCDYDAALLEAFNHMVDDQGFRCKDSFTTITPASWKHHVPLQAVDLVAYENFKDGQRRLKKKNKMRKSLELLLDLESIGGRARGFDEQSLRELKRIMDGLDEQTKEILLVNARIRKKGNP